MKPTTKNTMLLATVFVLISFLFHHNSKIQQKLFPAYCSTKNLNQLSQSQGQAQRQGKEVGQYFSHSLDCISCLYFEQSSNLLQVGNIWIQQPLQNMKNQNKDKINQMASITGLTIVQTDCYEYECSDFHLLQDFSYKNIDSKAKLLKYGFLDNLNNLNLQQIQCSQNKLSNVLCWKSQAQFSNKIASSLILRHRMTYNSTQKGLIQQIPRVIFKHTVYSVLNPLIVVLMWFMIIIGSNHRKLTKNMSQLEVKVFLFGSSILVLMLLMPLTQKYASAIFIGLCIHFLPLIFYDIKCLGWLWIFVSFSSVLITQTIFFQLFQKIAGFFLIILLLLYGAFSKLLLRDRILIWLIAFELVIGLIAISIESQLDNHILGLVAVYSLFGAICAQNCQLKTNSIQVKVNSQANLSAHELQDRIQRQLSNNQTQMII